MFSRMLPALVSPWSAQQSSARIMTCASRSKEGRSSPTPRTRFCVRARPRAMRPSCVARSWAMGSGGAAFVGGMYKGVGRGRGSGGKRFCFRLPLRAEGFRQTQRSTSGICLQGLLWLLPLPVEEVLGEASRTPSALATPSSRTQSPYPSSASDPPPSGTRCRLNHAGELGGVRNTVRSSRNSSKVCRTSFGMSVWVEVGEPWPGAEGQGMRAGLRAAGGSGLSGEVWPGGDGPGRACTATAVGSVDGAMGGI
mmetsp:Transcript_115550/g.201073  ORF Transcript_115550/g.201073 Transcript_115550/m.201073 type:complete len:253 (-) Transcript_115550:37-795(-)